jgi:hypothetical protein
LLVPPADLIGNAGAARHRRIPLPADLYGPSRKNSAGVELGHAESLDALLAEIAAASVKPFPDAGAIIDGKAAGGTSRPVSRRSTARPLAPSRKPTPPWPGAPCSPPRPASMAGTARRPARVPQLCARPPT